MLQEVQELQHLVAAFRRVADQWRGLIENEDDSHSGEEACHHGVRDEPNEASEPQHAKDAEPDTRQDDEEEQGGVALAG